MIVLETEMHLHVIHASVYPEVFISCGLPDIHLNDVEASCRLYIFVHQPQKNS